MGCLQTRKIMCDSSIDAGHADTQVPSDLPIYHLFKMTLEMRVGNNAQHDHNILNHCGPEKQERTMNATHNGLDKVSKVTKEKYLASIGGALCTACNLTPDRKKGISAQSGRVKIDTAKPQKHLKAIVQLNVTADSVKTGVKLACENAFRRGKRQRPVLHDRPCQTMLTKILTVIHRFT